MFQPILYFFHSPSTREWTEKRRTIIFYHGSSPCRGSQQILGKQLLLLVEVLSPIIIWKNLISLQNPTNHSLHNFFSNLSIKATRFLDLLRKSKISPFYVKTENNCLPNKWGTIFITTNQISLIIKDHFTEMITMYKYAVGVK